MLNQPVKVKENIFKRISNIEKMMKIKNSNKGLARIDFQELQSQTQMSR